MYPTTLTQRPVPFSQRSGRWVAIALSLAIAVILGLASALYTGPAAGWVASELGGACYAMAWCFGLALLRPGAAPTKLAGAGLAVSCGLEALQLWHPALLEVWRAEPLGRVVFGGAFAWTDLAVYLAGAMAAGGWLAALPGGPRRLSHVRPMGVA